MGKKRRECWARIAGNCSGDLTDEHPYGRGDGLFTPEVYWQGFNPELDDRVIPVNSVKRPVLCEGHNHLFSVETDPAAHNAHRAIREWFWNEAPDPADTDILWSPATATIDGYGFGRWLCKLSCNLRAMKDETPYPDYAHWAVGATDRRRCWFYFRFPSTDGLDFRRQVRYSNFDVDYADGATQLVCGVRFMGLEFLITPEPLETLKPTLVKLGPHAFDARWVQEPRSLRRTNRPGVADTAFLNFTNWTAPE